MTTGLCYPKVNDLRHGILGSIHVFIYLAYRNGIEMTFWISISYWWEAGHRIWSGGTKPVGNSSTNCPKIWIYPKRWKIDRHEFKTLKGDDYEKILKELPIHLRKPSKWWNKPTEKLFFTFWEKMQVMSLYWKKETVMPDEVDQYFETALNWLEVRMLELAINYCNLLKKTLEWCKL